MNEDQRFWIHTSVVEDQPEVGMPFGDDTVGIVDEEEGGVFLYVHKDNAQTILDTLKKVELLAADPDDDVKPHQTDVLLDLFRQEEEANVKVSENGEGEYVNTYRDTIRDGLLFALDLGWDAHLPEDDK